MNNLAGIDYGSKLAGTTAIAYVEGERIVVRQSEKKKDADLFLQGVVDAESIDTVFIDAPLSLPKAYFGDGDDFFYRACDRALKAMSPMFLGGLTARAMKLHASWQSEGRRCYETYPGYTAKQLGLIDHGYKKDRNHINNCLEIISGALPSAHLPHVDNWHAVDALLALLVAVKYQDKKHQTIGDPKEGCIYC